MVVCQPPFSMPRLSSPSPEKLPKENALQVGDTSRWSSCSRNGTPILRGRLFPAWWNGMEPFLSLSSLRLLNYRNERWRVRHRAKARLQFASQRAPWPGVKYRKRRPGKSLNVIQQRWKKFLQCVKRVKETKEKIYFLGFFFFCWVGFEECFSKCSS